MQNFQVEINCSLHSRMENCHPDDRKYDTKFDIVPRSLN